MSEAKIRVVYTPEGGSRREWVVDLLNPSWDITYGTEKATDWPWQTFTERLGNMSFIAIRALLFTLRKRDEPRLEIDAVRVELSEVAIEEVEPDAAATDDGTDGDPKES